MLVLCYFLSFLLRVCSWAKRLGSGARGSQLGPLSHPRSERDTDLTCMAAVAAPAYQPGTFLLVSRPPDWDEIWVAGVSVDGSDLIGRTSAADGSAWMWTVVRPVALSVAAPVLGGGARRAPAGIPQGAVNWICVPPACDQQWNPDVVEVVALTQEAHRFVAHMQANPGAFTCNQAGVGGALLVEAVMPAPAMAPGGAGVGAGLGNPGAVGLGLPAAGGGPSPSNAELKALEAAVTQLQQLALDKDDKKKKDKDKDRRRKKSRKKSKKSKKKKKKSKRSSSSRSSSSRSSRSRSRSSSSTSSSSSGKGKPLKWREHGKDQKVSYSDLAHVDQLRLKKRGDLLAFAAKSPGALTAHFLAGIYAVEGQHQSIQPAARGQCSELGPSIQRFVRGARSERSFDPLRDPRSHQQKGDCKGFGCAMSEDCGNSASKGKRWIVGEGGGVGVGDQPTVLGSQQHAGPDELMRRRVRRSWHSMGGTSLQDSGFEALALRGMTNSRQLEVSAVAGSHHHTCFL